jgi:hypothetical protein
VVLRSCRSTLGQKMLRSIWLGSEIASSLAATMSRRAMSAGQRSFKSLLIAIERADHTILFDNSSEEGYRLVAVLGLPQNRWFEPVPAWATVIKP